ncbi:hypothetical protein ACVWYN_000943 [Pedobacter sp. UYP24]
MVAKIVSGKSIRGMLHYNENKVDQGQARLILANGFAGEISKMDFGNKLRRFENLTMFNGKVKTNAIHISLNFDQSDKLNDELLQQITMDYMEKIGFGDQPYLVYRHTDASHPHLHITTTNIKSDSLRIDIHNIGKTLSEAARKEIEIDFSLTKAEGRKLSDGLGIKPADLEKAVYGKSATKRAITNIVNSVVSSYCFTSLAEFNAILKQFNVIADRGLEDTHMFQKNGLIYSIIDASSKQVGVSIKASSIYNTPTLSALKPKFAKNIEKRKPYRDGLKKCIDQLLNKYEILTRTTFVSELRKQKIVVTFRQSEQGFVYGSTFIDHNNKTVFNGRDLGKAYSAKALIERFGNTDKLKTYLKQTNGESNKTYLEPLAPTNYLKDLLGRAETDYAPTTDQKKKKRKQGQGFSR